MEVKYDEMDRLILWYVKCQNDEGRGAQEEELLAFGRWYDEVQANNGLIKLMLDGRISVTMQGDEPAFCLRDNGRG